MLSGMIQVNLWRKEKMFVLIVFLKCCCVEDLWHTTTQMASNANVCSHWSSNSVFCFWLFYCLKKSIHTELDYCLRCIDWKQSEISWIDRCSLLVNAFIQIDSYVLRLIINNTKYDYQFGETVASESVVVESNCKLIAIFVFVVKFFIFSYSTLNWSFQFLTFLSFKSCVQPPGEITL